MPVSPLPGPARLWSIQETGRRYRVQGLPYCPEAGFRGPARPAAHRRQAAPFDRGRRHARSGPRRCRRRTAPGPTQPISARSVAVGPLVAQAAAEQHPTDARAPRPPGRCPSARTSSAATSRTRRSRGPVDPVRGVAMWQPAPDGQWSRSPRRPRRRRRWPGRTAPPPAGSAGSARRTVIPARPGASPPPPCRAVPANRGTTGRPSCSTRCGPARSRGPARRRPPGCSARRFPARRSTAGSGEQYLGRAEPAQRRLQRGSAAPARRLAAGRTGEPRPGRRGRPPDPGARSSQVRRPPPRRRRRRPARRSADFLQPGSGCARPGSARAGPARCAARDLGRSEPARAGRWCPAVGHDPLRLGGVPAGRVPPGTVRPRPVRRLRSAQTSEKS